MKLPIPYQGDQKYIFISYSHKDISKVDEIICKLSESGYNVWFDSGIVPGSEWDENIAQHIEKCGCFIAFMSENYLESNNCKDELNYARDLEKDRLVVYLEEVTLPSGLAMRINRLQSVFKYAYKSENDFYEKLFSADCLAQCKVKKSEEKIRPVLQSVENIEAEKTSVVSVMSDEEALSYLTDGMQSAKLGKKKTKTRKVRKLDVKTILLVNVLFWVITLCLLPSGFAFVMLPALIALIVFNATTIKVSVGKKEKISAITSIVFNVIFIVLSCLFL
ncbi:MAG: toll/interleukin-1 receptor domain-containing protein [Ruminococcaceae bacterium]|nr:toll/interleukin-1 receptor domain-containing protein [Oscillospiraceae bacterium]